MGWEEDMGPVMQALSEARQSARLMADWLSVLEREKPDVAVVNPPFYLLGTVIKACLARGIHVFGEKPLAIDRQDLLGVTHMAGRPAGPKLMAMLSMRYEPAFIAGQRYVAVGSLGLPLLITAQKSYPLLGWNGKPRDAFYHRRETYGGTIPWIGIHVIDQFRWFSESQFTEVRAMHTTLGNQGHGEMEIAATLELDPAPSMFTAFLDWISHGTPMRLSTADCLAASEAALLARDSADQGQVRLF
jgi:predicted dehydrogenase